MPVISDIQQQKQSKSRFSVFIDGKYGFAMSDLDLSTSGLKVGQELSAQQIETYVKTNDDNRMYEKALGQLSRRRRSVAEMRDYLVRSGATRVDAVLERLKRDNLLDDQEFANAWVADRVALRPRSRAMLRKELAGKGLSRTDIDETVSSISPEEEAESAFRVAQKKARLTQYQDHNKLAGFLARQGYSYDVIKKALARLFD